MAVTMEEILAAARELAGRAMTDGEEKILSVLCAGELNSERVVLVAPAVSQEAGGAWVAAAGVTRRCLWAGRNCRAFPPWRSDWTRVRSMR